MKAQRLGLWLLLVLALPVCAEIRVIDSVGREVVLEAPARRIIALAPHVVETLYSAGAGDRLIGVVSHSDYPPAARELPEVGSFQSWSLETIIAMQPDLVLLWGSGNGMDKVVTLERLGLTTYVSEPRRLEDIADTIRAIGTLAGTESAANAEAERIHRELTSLRTRHRREIPISVFYQVWNQPLQTLSGEHLISDVITLCGGYNIFADETQLAPRINLESVLARDPQAIVASGSGASRPQWLNDWLQYPGLRAVRSDSLFFVDPDLIQRPTARILLGAQQLCDQLDTVPND